MCLCLQFQTEYLVKWAGESESENTWISANDLLYKDAIKDFENSLMSNNPKTTIVSQNVSDQFEINLE